MTFWEESLGSTPTLTDGRWPGRFLSRQSSLSLQDRCSQRTGNHCPALPLLTEWSNGALIYWSRFSGQ